MTDQRRKSDIDEANKEYWNEPCGTNSYKKLGFKSYKEFDRWYFDFYPYLDKHIPFGSVRERRVLEVGLGLGTVSERLAQKGADYHGLDIAEEPVAEVNHRLTRYALNERATVGNVLECPWDDGFFDVVISIGCLHHTGDMNRAISELIRVLKPGGQGVIMVYNAFSYRQWLSSPLATYRTFRNEQNRHGSRHAAASERSKYDHNSSGEAAPCTEFIGRQSLLGIITGLGLEAQVHSENIGSYFMFPLPRKLKLKLFSSSIGLDLYVTFSKPKSSSESS